MKTMKFALLAGILALTGLSSCTFYALQAEGPTAGTAYMNVQEIGLFGGHQGYYALCNVDGKDLKCKPVKVNIQNGVDR